ncbi:MAG TPA: hypothetical protein VFV88_16235 [Steroidobacteraceae bacterium]|jgi:hypothetical protein|nr:hypothetical protein [Steroidobacteraceae bacterium]
MNTRFALHAAAVASLLLLGACAKQEQPGEVAWAKAALARNPAIEILSTDEAAGTIKFRDTNTGAMYQMKAQELMAAPPPANLAQNDAPEKPAAEPAPAAAAPAEPVEPVEEAPAQTTETVAAVRGAGESLAEGPGYSITRGAQQDTVASRSLEGPGYSITREGPSSRQSQPDAEAVATNVVKRTDPIICQGDRLMRIDGETIEFTGDAVIAENGCDLYISNARIRAGGVGIIARQARVHIVNSTIGGTLGSYEASQGAEIYVARSTFAGIGRRFDTATMNDLGGNEYQLHH